MRRHLDTGPGTLEIGSFLRLTVAIRAKRHGGPEKQPATLATWP